MASKFEMITLSLTTLLTAFLIFLYFYFTRNFNFWKELGIPYVKPLPFVGNLKEVLFQKRNIGTQLQRIFNEYGDKSFVGIFAFDQPSLVIRDLDLVKNILIKNAQHFIDRSINLDENLDPLFGKNLSVMKGDRWRHVRVNLFPSFTSSKMKMMFYLVEMCGKELVKYLDMVTADGSSVEVKETMAKFTTDVIASCTFDINSNSLTNPDSEIKHYMRNVFDFSIKKGLAALTALFAPDLKRIFKLKLVDDITTDYFRKTVWRTVEHREKNEVVRNDFLDSWIEMRNKWKKSVQEDKIPTNSRENDANFEIHGDDFVAQAIIFATAGFETSATTMSYVLYELALHPDIQHRVRTEIMQVLDRYDGELTYDGIHEMSYLDMVLREALRKYPVVSFLDRRCCSDYKLPSPSGKGTVTLPEGTGIYITVMGIHNDPKYYPEPEKFNPERFTEENKKSRPSYTYLPFGEGPRMCIGMRFGLMQVKTGLIHMLSCYKVTPCKDTPLSIVYDPKSFLLMTKGEIPLSFKRI